MPARAEVVIARDGAQPKSILMRLERCSMAPKVAPRSYSYRLGSRLFKKQECLGLRC